jgi:ribosomal protein S12 methylthiotransferase accessory factor
LAAVLELVERDAAALWWIGGRKPRTLPLEALTETGASVLLDQLRQGSRMRRTWLLDLTTDLEIPCVAALSENEAGSGFACGLGACTSLGGAARLALLELCQMELATVLVAAKVHESGVRALSSAERRTWLLSQFNARGCSAVMGWGIADTKSLDARQDKSERLDGLMKQLLRHGFECSFTDLTQDDIAVPCTRAIVPGLQPLSADTQTPRLAAILGKGGCGPLYTDGLELL